MVKNQKKNLSSNDKADAIAKIVLQRYESACNFKSQATFQNTSADEWYAKMWRAYNKVHEPQEKQMNPEMRSYFGLIQLKIDSTFGWIRNLSMSYQDSPVYLLPTEDFDLPEWMNKEAENKFKLDIVNKLNASGVPINEIINPVTGKIWAELSTKIKQIAQDEKESVRKSAKQHLRKVMQQDEIVIRDQLSQGNWRQAYSELVFNALLYPASVMSFGDYQKQKAWVWDKNKLKRIDKEMPMFKSVPFNRSYFAPDANSAQDGAFFIERLSMTRYDLIQLKKNDSAFGSVIDTIMRDMAHSNREWLSERESNKESSWQDTETVEILKMDGRLLGSDLKRVNADIGVDDNKILNVIVLVCDSKTIYLDIQNEEMAGRNYASVGYSSDNSNGAYKISLGMKLYDRQLRLNRLDFFQAVNESKAYGPLIERYSGAFSHGSDGRFQPFAVSETNLEKSSAQQAYKFHHIQPQYRQLHQQFISQLRIADDECGIPAFQAFGTGEQAQTLGQDVMRQAAASKGLQSFGMNIDENIIEPVFDIIYHENIIRSENREFSGDAYIKPRGITERLNRELQRTSLQQNMNNLISMAGAGLLPKELVQSAAQSYAEAAGLNIDEFVNDDLPAEVQAPATNAPATPAYKGEGQVNNGTLG